MEIFLAIVAGIIIGGFIMGFIIINGIAKVDPFGWFGPVAKPKEKRK